MALAAIRHGAWRFGRLVWAWRAWPISHSAGRLSLDASGQTGSLALSALFGLGVQAFAEEYVFRGYLTQGLLLATQTAVAGGDPERAGVRRPAHSQWRPAVGQRDPVRRGHPLIAIRTGGIAFGYGLHLINNLFGAVIVVSAGDVFNGAPGLWTQTTPGLMWWDVALGVALARRSGWTVLRPRAATADEAPASRLM